MAPLNYLLLSAIFSSSVVAGSKRVMTWVCLEFSQESEEQITFNLAQLDAHKDILSAVSFEKYTLGPNSTLVDNNLTPVSSDIIAMGLEAWPLLSSYPHPPEFIDWMRTVFKDPQPFIDQCVSEAKKYGYFGYNLDWEPTDAVTEQDGQDYASFIQVFADGLHANGFKLSVDVATWSVIWDYSSIAATSADIVISMGTYTSSDSSFTNQLTLIMDSFHDRAGVGLETVNASTGERIPMDEVVFRFEQIKAAGAKEIDFWKSPVPPLWWPLIADFVRSD